MTIICGHCKDATMTKLALGANYATARDNGNIINFLIRLKVTCYESNDGGLSHKQYKIAVTVKALHNYTNLKPRFSRIQRRTQGQIQSNFGCCWKVPLWNWSDRAIDQ